MNTPLLNIQNLRQCYKKKTILDDVSLAVFPAETVGLLGPNGAGKSSAFHIIAGFCRPSSGTISFANHSIDDLGFEDRAKLGLAFLPQEASIFRELSVRDNILAPLELRSDLNATEKNDKLEHLLSAFNLEHIQSQPGFSLSGGERRRTEIARCLTLDPKVILLDEPFAGIDPVSINSIKQMLQKLNQLGISILITDHNARDMLNICHRSYVLFNTKILAHGSSKAIINDPKVRQYYLGQNF
jgi:lipopolysaccharide export system ATP-binding protein